MYQAFSFLKPVISNRIGVSHSFDFEITCFILANQIALRPGQLPLLNKTLYSNKGPVFTSFITWEGRVGGLWLCHDKIYLISS